MPEDFVYHSIKVFTKDNKFAINLEPCGIDFKGDMKYNVTYQNENFKTHFQVTSQNNSGIEGILLSVLKSVFDLKSNGDDIHSNFPNYYEVENHK